jgi:two-component system LytT family sensor kinase
MAKTTFFIIALLCFCFSGFSQVTDTVKPFGKTVKGQPFGQFIRFDGDYIDKSNIWMSNGYMVADTAVYRVFDYLKLAEQRHLDSMRKVHLKSYFPRTRLRSKIMLGVKLDPRLTNYISDRIIYGNKTYQGYTITNDSKALVVALGINKNNVKNYRYHVVENDSTEVVHWRLPKLAQAFGAKVPYALLGEFKAIHKQILVEVVNIKDYSVRDGVVFDWKTNLKPSISEMTVYGKNDYFSLADTSANHHLATKFPPNSQVPLDFKFRKDDIISMAIAFNYHAPAPYTFHLIKTINGHKTDTTQIAGIGANDDVYNFHKDYYSQPGQYELIIQPLNLWEDNQLLRISFKVLPPLKVYQRFTISQLMPYAAGLLVLISLFFTVYFLYNKRKINKVNQQKALANLKLSSVRSQLNPHFMFNALTSIQNLMNQHDNVSANHYLNKFSDLTRQILNNSGKELISLEDELTSITNYLQMEQLRFGFDYEIEIGPGINTANTEIPAMMLQPFIENAARHGVSALGSKGKIYLSVSRQQNDLILKVSDNGPGFKESESKIGLGLKLSEERIDLLNKLYPDQAFSIEIDRKMKGAGIIIKLTEWF